MGNANSYHAACRDGIELLLVIMYMYYSYYETRIVFYGLAA